MLGYERMILNSRVRQKAEFNLSLVTYTYVSLSPGIFCHLQNEDNNTINFTDILY
jgi:hypothetical protein